MCLVTQALVSVSADDVRDVVNITSEKIPDNKISKMIKRAETAPNPQILKTVEKLKKFNFNPVFLTSEIANLNKLQNMTKKQLKDVRTVIKGVTGIYRKRIAGTKKAFLNNQEYGAIIDAADAPKLAKMIRILGFLTQTKVYLFWKNKQKKIKI